MFQTDQEDFLSLIILVMPDTSNPLFSNFDASFSMRLF